MDKSSRAMFEEWFADSRRSRGPSKRPTFDRLGDETYADDHTQRHWWTWQQAQAAERERCANIAESWSDYGNSVTSIGPRIARSIRVLTDQSLSGIQRG